MQTFIMIRPSRDGGYLVQERDLQSGKIIEDGNYGPYSLAEARAIAIVLAHGTPINEMGVTWAEGRVQ